AQGQGISPRQKFYDRGSECGRGHELDSDDEAGPVIDADRCGVAAKMSRARCEQKGSRAEVIGSDGSEVAIMGVLSGYRVIELAGIGPGPMCAMLLSDMGADVLRIDRAADAGLGIAMDPKYSLLNRGRRSVAFDLKKPEAIEAVL